MSYGQRFRSGMNKYFIHVKHKSFLSSTNSIKQFKDFWCPLLVCLIINLTRISLVLGSLPLKLTNWDFLAWDALCPYFFYSKHRWKQHWMYKLQFHRSHVDRIGIGSSKLYLWRWTNSYQRRCFKGWLKNGKVYEEDFIKLKN